MKNILAFLFIAIILASSGCTDKNADKKINPAIPTSTIKTLSESEAGTVSLNYLSEKYPGQPSFEVYGAILRPSGNWQMYVRNTNSRGIICIDKSGKASGLYDMNADCN